jgi:hypothetical protein
MSRKACYGTTIILRRGIPLLCSAFPLHPSTGRAPHLLHKPVACAHVPRSKHDTYRNHLYSHQGSGFQLAAFGPQLLGND